MKALNKNGTTELIMGKRTVECKWVYTLKHIADELLGGLKPV